MGSPRRAQPRNGSCSLTGSGSTLAPEWRRWVESVAAGPIVGARRGFAGGSRQLWFLEIDVGGDSRRLVLRLESGGAFAGTELSLAREAVVYRALRGTNVPVAEMVAFDDAGSAMVLEHLPGRSDHRDLKAASSASVLTSFFDSIGALHTLDASRLDLPTFSYPSTPADHALADLGLWEEVADAHLSGPEPMLAYARAWLRRHAPVHVEHTVLVQGDTGPGNFLHDGNRVTGLVDWEFSHLGDPMDDIAWIDMRSAGGGPAFADVERRDRCYRDATGVDVDPDRVRYYAVMVYLRCAITTGVTIARGGGAVGLGAYHAPHHRFLIQLGAALADAMDVDVPAPDLPDPGDGSAPTHDHAIAGLRDVVLPAVPDADTKLRARAALLVLEHDRAATAIGPELDADQQDDDRRTFGGAPGADEFLRIAAEAGAEGDVEILGYLWRSAHRSARCWQTPAVGGVRPPTPPSM